MKGLSYTVVKLVPLRVRTKEKPAMNWHVTWTKYDIFNVEGIEVKVESGANLTFLETRPKPRVVDKQATPL